MTEKHLERVRREEAERRRNRKQFGPKGIFFLVLCVCFFPYVLQTATSWSARRPDAWKTFYVSAGALLPRDFTVDLETVEGVQVDARIAASLRLLLQDARKAGADLRVSGGYWNIREQQERYETLFQEYKSMNLSDEECAKLTGRAVQPPGGSEHHTGLAVDFAGRGDGDFSESAAYRWLMKYAADYGFILRYPEGKESLTGIMYKPWHFRYVGEEAAAAMSASGDCLEEYLSIHKKEEE